jgi:CHAD domain-containing protein
MLLDYVKLKDVKPALAGYINESLTLLKSSPTPDEEAVHDIRVLMKKSRAVMKLLSTQLDQESFKRDYSAFREVGRILSLRRETSVYRKTLKDLKKGHTELFSRLQDNEKLNILMKKPDPIVNLSPEGEGYEEKTTSLLLKAGFRVRFQTMTNLNPQLLLKELEVTYNTAATKYLISRNILKSVNIHEFRKKTKDFLYQLYFFRPLNPEVIKALEKKLDVMAQNLGKYHDLTQIMVALQYKLGNPENTPAMDEMMVVIKNKQDEYLEKVWPVAYKIFCPGQKLVNALGFKILVI